MKSYWPKCLLVASSSASPASFARSSSCLPDFPWTDIAAGCPLPPFCRSTPRTVCGCCPEHAAFPLLWSWTPEPRWPASSPEGKEWNGGRGKKGIMKDKEGMERKSKLLVICETFIANYAASYRQCLPLAAGGHSFTRHVLYFPRLHFAR